jgi:sulfofructose kinase
MNTQPPLVLCAGIIVLDEVFTVDAFPAPGGKTEAGAFFTVNGGCAANAAVAVARLGGRAALAGPLGGPEGVDRNGDLVLAALLHEHVDVSGCQRVAGAPTPISAIAIDSRGDRMIVTYRDARIAAATPLHPDRLVRGADVVLVDNRFPNFVLPICKAARARGITVVLDADRPTHIGEELFPLATHVVFSSECLRATAVTDDLAAGLARMAGATPAFLAVTNGAQDVLWRAGSALRRTPVFALMAVDTLAAGDVFHAGFALALAERQSIPQAIRFAAAAAGLKCTRLGGSAAAPARTEVEALLAKSPVGLPIEQSRT